MPPRTASSPTQSSAKAVTLVATADLERLARALRDHEADLHYWSKSYSEAAPTLSIALDSAATTLREWHDWLKSQR